MTDRQSIREDTGETLGRSGGPGEGRLAPAAGLVVVAVAARPEVSRRQSHSGRGAEVPTAPPSERGQQGVNGACVGAALCGGEPGPLPLLSGSCVARRLQTPPRLPPSVCRSPEPSPTSPSARQLLSGFLEPPGPQSGSVRSHRNS